MPDQEKPTFIAPGKASAAGTAVGALPGISAPLAPGQRWSAARKREVVLRMLRGEPLDVLSRELGVEVYRLEAWRDKALRGMEAHLKEREGEPVQVELDAALKRIGELSMENELLRARCQKPGPFGRRMWPR